MAGSVALSYRLFGQDVSASSALEGVGKAADDAGKKVKGAAEDGGDGLGRLGEGADKSEARILGLKDSVDGLATVLQGPGEQGVAAYLQGWADMASGVANFIVPTLSKLVPTVVKNAAATAWSTTTQLAAGAAAKVMAAGQWLLNAALSANPIGLVVIAIAALVAAFVLAWNNSETFRRIVTAAWEAVKGAAMAVGDWFMNTLWPLIKSAIGFVIGYYRLMWTTFQSVVKWVLEKGATFIGWFTELPEKMRSAVSGLWDGLKDGFRGAINWIIEKWNSFSIGLPAVDAGPLGTIGGWTIDTPNIPMLAGGGIVRRRPGGILANIGEGRFDEAVIPLDGRSGFGGGVVELHLHGPVFGGSRSQIGRELADMIDEAKTSGRGGRR